jgi:hypothetical protein
MERTMTEREWLAGEDAPEMLLHLLAGTRSRRKLRLFACAVCRRVGAGMQSERGRRALELAEAFADGLIHKRVMTAARSAARLLPRLAADAQAWRAADIAVLADPLRNPTLLRDIFGNPFRPPVLDPSWLTWRDGLVVKMARDAHDDRLLPGGTLDNSRLAVLADALEDAGCGDEDILRHCRRPGEHVRGCWVIDLLLGKA